MDCGRSPGIMASAPSRAGAGFGSGVPASRHGQRPNDRIQAGDEFATIQIAESLRDGDHGAGITAAVLQQEHPVVRVLRQPAGQYRTDGSGADDDDDAVEVHYHISCSLFKDLSPGAGPVTTSESPTDLIGVRT